MSGTCLIVESMLVLAEVTVARLVVRTHVDR